MKANRTKKSDGSGKCIALAVIAFSLAMPASTAIPSIAEAQEYRREQRRGLFDLLFGGALRQRQPERPATR